MNHGEFGKKPRVNSKRKGATFERKIAKLLNERFKTNEFSRTPGSGAFGSTHSLPQHFIVRGDIITPQNFRYVIECKNGYSVELDDLFNDGSDFYKFIEQSQKDAEVTCRDWMVIYKKNRRKEIVVVGSPFDSLPNHLCVRNTYYVYPLKDVLNLSEAHWFA